MSSSFRLIRKLARKLKYLPLELLWNYPITINSIATLETDIRAELGKIVPAGCSLLTETERIHGMLAKYDFIDLTFRVPDYLLLQSYYQSGISLLRELLPVKEPSNEEEDYQEIDDEFFKDLFILEMLAEEVDAGLTLCRMVLHRQSPRPYEERAKINSRTLPRLILPNNYFPHRFVIGDACLTNAQAVWFFKHFYL